MRRRTASFSSLACLLLLISVALAACATTSPAEQGPDRPREEPSAEEILAETASIAASSSASFECRYDISLFGVYPVKGSATGAFREDGYRSEIDVDDGYDEVQLVIGDAQYTRGDTGSEPSRRWLRTKVGAGRDRDRAGFHDPRAYLDLLRLARLSEDRGTTESPGGTLRHLTLAVGFDVVLESLFGADTAEEFVTAREQVALIDVAVVESSRELRELDMRYPDGGTIEFRYTDWGERVELSPPEDFVAY